EVNVFYAEGRRRFTAEMDGLIVEIAGLVERRLREAKDEVARGRAEIRTYVAGLAPSLQTVGKQAQAAVADRFGELERGMDEKKNDLAQKLAQRYKEAHDKADELLKQIQDENKGLVAAFVEKLEAVIKALKEFKEKLLALLRKGEETIRLILADPIGFLSNL